MLIQVPPSLVNDDVINNICTLMQSAPPGAVVEVGVYKGGSAFFLSAAAELQSRPVFLYDTFTGIPHRTDIDSHRIGDFSDTSADDVQRAIPYATVVQGVFPASAVPMPPVAVAHLDCDQYQSVLEAVRYLLPRMVPGGLIWFDDVPCLAGATQAVSELFHPHELLYGKGGKAYVLVTEDMMSRKDLVL